ncbi:hypothetical protein [Komagataeibacter sp. FXV3]|uniref:hypothetical protein n=1 Tax=Komagataeibacter sp. FXV3 TaxID=2608998 RepID=UPI00187B5C7D|nr:hypothetical protein [Komagataeibacter sp. FXV3]
MPVLPVLPPGMYPCRAAGMKGVSDPAAPPYGDPVGPDAPFAPTQMPPARRTSVTTGMIGTAPPAARHLIVVVQHRRNPAVHGGDHLP